MNRRSFFRNLGATLTALPFVGRRTLGAQKTAEFPVMQITSSPAQHWFGYYDKWQIDATGRYALGNEVEVIFRSPTPQDRLEIGLVDLEGGNRWTGIGHSTAWGWQQGCMLQWIPGSSEEVIWNDHGDGKYGLVSKVFNVRTGKSRELPLPIYTLSPDGSFALCVDFGRLQYYRPGYGYAVEGRDFQTKAPENSGIYKMDLETGAYELIISYADVAALGGYPLDISDYYHWINHLLINPSGTRFIFLNRSRPIAPVEAMNRWYETNREIRFSGSSAGRYLTRAMTADLDGGDIYPLNDSGRFSHFIWKGDEVITAWSATDDGGKSAFYEFPDKTKEYRLIDDEAMPTNGHNTYVPNTDYEWILNDTYPQGEERLQTLYLYHVPTKKKVVLGRFHEPEKFRGEWRCDLHPRTDPQGQRVFFDSTHVGGRRQMYAIDISGII